MDAVAQALADPIRRDILRMLSRRNHTAGELDGAFSVSRPAVSRHLRVLREAGLVRDTLRGRHREYQLVVAALDALEAYLETLRAPSIDWERRFAALETEVYRVRNQRRGAARRAAPVRTAAAATKTKAKTSSETATTTKTNSATATATTTETETETTTETETETTTETETETTTETKTKKESA